MKYSLLIAICYSLLPFEVWASPCMHCEQYGQVSCDICLRDFNSQEGTAGNSCPKLNLIVTKVERPVQYGTPFKVDMELRNTGNITARI